MNLLVDADLVAYRVAATVTEDMDMDIAFYRMDVLVQQIIEATEGASYSLYLTGKDNFRKKINTDYKANRKDTVPPVYLQECREYLVENHKAIISNGCEADDLLGLNQTQDSVICSLDKDLLMIPGKHFNWTRLEFTHVKPLDGIRTFYKQMLIGDRSDNIFGVNKIGPVKAEKLIEHLDDEQEMFDTVYSLYNDPKRFVMNANCLWIWRNKNELWQDRVQDLILPDDCLQEVTTTSDFMKSLKVDT